MLSHYRRVITAALAAAVVVGVSGRPLADPRPAVSARQDDVRGLWVLRSSLATPARIDELIRTAVDGGYNTLLVQVRGRGDAYFQSDLEPRAAELAGQPATFDPLARVIDRARAHGLKVHAWFNVNLVASAAAMPGSRAHIVSRQPDWLMVPRQIAPALARLDPRSTEYTAQLVRWTRANSATVEGLYLSPVPEASQAYTLEVVRDLMARYGLDGLHLDYIRYPSADFDHSPAALAAFRESRLADVAPPDRERLDERSMTDPLVWTRTYPVGWETFRRERLTTLVERIRQVVRETRPDALISAAVLPVAEEARRQKLQDWSIWAGLGLIDVVCPMAYATALPDFSRQMAEAKAGALGRPVWAGIGAWRMPADRTAVHIREARRFQAAGVLLFSYDSLLTASAPRGAYFTRLRPALLAVDEEP